ncbi:MAG TPA: helix-turn-helix domain-containing protein [Acidobacteriaceae bacterium]|nr:helix-turn-helix domain-containing protein [Acidobacteriaceae bacterium]
MVEIGADSGLRVGRDLRQERERRNVTLEQVAKATRFSMRHLQSLEADLFDELPSGVLRKGLIRSYCKHLGLDDELWLERFAASGAFDQSEPDLAQFAENVHRARLEAMPPVRRRWWGVVVMVLGLLALAYAAWHYVVQPRMGVRHHEAPPVESLRTPGTMPGQL